MAYINPLDNLSYTNKDFQTIYPELLELVKKLSYKWDPTISNESDPGVLLIKLNAIINDKTNYVSDKNVLETFPSTVTQLPNAFELFSTLGYDMRWYNSATTTVAMKLNPESDIEEDTSYDIPAFTTISDDENSVVYTTLDKVTVNSVDDVVTCPAMEGIPVRYAIGDNDIVTIADLDNNNRIYLPDYNVAQNSIIVSNVITSETETINDTNTWKQVENLNVQPRNIKVFKFGLSADLNMCYLQFPSDIADIIGNGITIRYLKSAGQYGNIPTQSLSKFYDTVVQDDGTPIDTSLIVVTNSTRGIGGEDPEDIDSGYTHYKETVGVFETLVSLRDYLDYILSHNLAGDAIVTDRTNDLQCSYDILVENAGLYAPKHIIKENNGGKDELDAFDLKITALRYFPSNSITTKSLYDQTFDLQPYFNENYKSVSLINALEDTKSIQHDFAYLDPIYSNVPSGVTQASISDTTSTTTNTISIELEHAPMFIQGDSTHYLVVPDFDNILAPMTHIEVTVKVGGVAQTISAYHVINNTLVLTLSEELSAETNYTIDEFTYYPNLPDPKVLFYKNYYPLNCKVFPTIKLSDKQVEEVQENIRKSMYQLLCSNNVSFGTPISWEEVLDSMKRADDRIKNVILEDITYKTMAVGYLNIGGVSTVFECPINDKVETPQTTEDFIIEEIRNSIEAKSILAGITPFLNYENTFNINITQDQPSPESIVEDVGNIATNFTKWAPITYDANTDSAHDKVTFTLQDNENLVISKPTYNEVTQYGLGVKYQTNIEFTEKDVYHTLKGYEYIMLFWKTEDSANAPYYFAQYNAGDVIKTSFALIENFVSPFRDEGPANYFVGKKSGKIPIDATFSNESGATVNINEWINENLLASNFNLSSSATLSIYNINATKLPTTAYNFYWVTHNVVDNKYALFTPFYFGSTANTSNKYLLKDGEYFVYANKTLSEHVILGPGTLLEREYTSDNSFFLDSLYCDVVDDINIANLVDITELPWVNKDNIKGLANDVSFKYQVREMIVLPPLTEVEISYDHIESIVDVEDYNFYISNDTFNIISVTNNDRGKVCKYLDINNLSLDYRLQESQNQIIPALSAGESDYYVYGALNINASAESPQLLPSITINNSSLDKYVNCHDSSTLFGVPFAYHSNSLSSTTTIPMSLQGKQVNRMWGWVSYVESDTPKVNYIELYNDDKLYGWEYEDALSEHLATANVTDNQIEIDWNIPTPYSVLLFGNYNTEFSSYDRQSHIKVQFIPELEMHGSSNTDLVSLNALSGVDGKSSYYVFVSKDIDTNIDIANNGSKTIDTTLYGNLFMKVRLMSGSATFTPNSDYPSITAADYFTKSPLMSVSEGEEMSYYFMLHSTGNYPTIKNGTFTAGATGAQLRIDSILMLSADSVQRVNSELIRHLVELDPNREFDYLYIPPDSVMIEDPLDSKSFFNDDHIFKAYTIPQLDVNSLFGETKNSKPIVVNE